jgi:hypothetical protein
MGKPFYFPAYRVMALFVSCEEYKQQTPARPGGNEERKKGGDPQALKNPGRESEKQPQVADKETRGKRPDSTPAFSG